MSPQTLLIKILIEVELKAVAIGITASHGTQTELPLTRIHVPLLPSTSTSALYSSAVAFCSISS